MGERLITPGKERQRVARFVTPSNDTERIIYLETAISTENENQLLAAVGAVAKSLIPTNTDSPFDQKDITSMTNYLTKNQGHASIKNALGYLKLKIGN